MLELVRLEELVLAPGSAGRYIDRWVNALFGEGPVELDLGVAGTLELLEDHVVHPRSRLDEGRGYDRQRASSVLRRNRAGGAKECLRLGHRCRVEPTAQRAAGTALDRVVRARHPSDRIEHDDDILAELHQSAG